jgi:hypothetical protein
MTSPAKIRANRRNGRKSRGPRTRAGKAMAARNARRHGLTLPLLCDPALSDEADALARQIAASVAGAAADARGHALAGRIAEAIIDLARVRAAKLPLVAALATDPRACRALFSLARLERYERCAAARRKRAIRAFDAAVMPRSKIYKTNPTEKAQ